MYQNGAKQQKNQLTDSTIEGNRKTNENQGSSQKMKAIKKVEVPIPFVFQS